MKALCLQIHIDFFLFCDLFKKKFFSFLFEGASHGGGSDVPPLLSGGSS